MKYIIMITIVIGLALFDFLTGIIKAYVKNDISSEKMRKGGLNKIAEIIVMVAACGLEIGITLLGAYYDASTLAEISGTVTAVVIFGYIVIMEFVSVLENYVEISPDAVWAKKLVKRLRGARRDENKFEDKKEN